MEYDDGVDVQPGEELTIGGDGIGHATYDMTGDGVADSVIMVSGENQVDVLTDTDHDGTVDTVYRIDGDGSVKVFDDQGGKFTQVGTGHLDDAGRIQTDTGGQTTGGGDGGTVDPNPGPNPGPNPNGGGGDVTLQIGSQSVDAGKGTLDLTGDGVKDTVVLRGSDGSTLLVTDADQNGQADNIAQINSDGSVTFATSDGNGGWVVAGHGQIDTNGNISQVPGGQTGQPFDFPQQLSTTDPTGGTGGDTGGTGGTGGTTDGGTTGGTGGTGGGATGGENVSVTMGGKEYDLGAATIDSDGNGSPDTVVVKADDGTTLVVTDMDGNGTGDQIIQINTDGTAVVQQSDGNGGWTTVATGRVDANGNLVIDKK